MKAYVRGERKAALIFSLIMPFRTDFVLGQQAQPIEAPIPSTVTIPASECRIPEPVRTSLPGCPSVVRLATYAIGQYEVTNEQFFLFVLDGGYRREEFWSPEGWHYRIEGKWEAPVNWPPSKNLATDGNAIRNTYRPQQRFLPVTGVSWYESEAYCRWLSHVDPNHEYRLPTELEWLYAAIGPDFRRWPWGDKWDPKRCNFCDISGDSWFPTGALDGFRPLAPVNAYENGKSRFGCYNMVGNAEEWCQEWYDRHGLSDKEIAAKIVDNPLGFYKVARGGHWMTAKQENLLPTRRAGTFPFVRRISRETTGIRICYTATQ